jgi:hypothetical protein
MNTARNNLPDKQAFSARDLALTDRDELKIERTSARQARGKDDVAQRETRGEFTVPEYQDRPTNRIERSLRQSDLPVEQSLARFDGKRSSAKVGPQLRML